jgi:WD40 repeat protein
VARRAARALGLALSIVALAGCGDSKPVTNLEPEATLPTGGSVKSVAWSRDALLAAGAGDSVIVWKDNEPAWRARQGGEGWGVAWSPDGKMLASAGADGTVRLWREGRLTETLPAAHGIAFSVAWSPDGRRLVSGYEDGTVLRWRPAAMWAGHTQEVIAVAWNDEIASGSIDSSVRVRDGDGHVQAVLSESAGADVNGLAWSPDGSTLAAANQDGGIRLWDPKDKKLVGRLLRHDGWARGVAWSPNGRSVASSGQDGMVRLWDPKEKKQLRAFRSGPADTWAVAWSPDGKRVASGNGDSTVRIWRVG